MKIRKEMMNEDDFNKGRPTRRERERRRQKEEILTAAAEIFARFGYHGAGIKQIADRAEMSVGKLYKHFEGKEDLYRELVEVHISELQTIGETAKKLEASPLQRLRFLINEGIAYFKRHFEFLVIYHNENPLNLGGRIRQEIKRNREFVSMLLSEAMDCGDIRKEDPDALASILIGAFHRLLDMYSDFEDKDAFDSIPGIIDRIILRPLGTKDTDSNET